LLAALASVRAAVGGAVRPGRLRLIGHMAAAEGVRVVGGPA
jgi:hypothetical protein